MNESSGLFIFPWYVIAIICSFLGFYIGWHARGLVIFYKVIEDFFKKRLASKDNILYISKYKKEKNVNK